MILIAGSGPLASAIERRLLDAGAALERIRSIADTDGQLASTQLEHATALLLTADDDSGNVDLVLQVRRIRPALPLVVRLFDSSLVSYLTETMPGVTILSMSKVAAPVFVDAARSALARQPAAYRRRVRDGIRRRYRVDRVLIVALLSFFLLVFPSALIFSRALDLRYLDALYFVWTTVTTVGYGDIALRDASDSIKLFGMAVMLAGPTFIAVLFALLSDWVLSRRLDLIRGRTRVRRSGHVLIVGAGNVGLRIAELLAAPSRHLVIIERDANSRNAAALRTAGHHVIIADATNEEALEIAGLDSAAIVLAVTDADAVNLQIALHARSCGVPVIMRVVSPELSAHVSERGDWIALSPVAAAAEAFAQAALSAGAGPRSAG